MTNPLFEGRVNCFNGVRILVVSDDDDEAIAAGVPEDILEALGPPGEIAAVSCGAAVYVRASLWPKLKAELEQLPARN